MSDEPKDSQEEPTQDSGLQTPQPDQPHPPVSQTVQPDESSYQPRVEGGDASQDPDQPRTDANLENPAAPVVEDPANDGADDN